MPTGSAPTAEVPWFAEPPPATLSWPPSTDPEGYLRFTDPNGESAVVPVTRDVHRANGTRNVWHIEVDADGRSATVSPSIHYIGFWHSPNPVTFRLVGS